MVRTLRETGSGTRCLEREVVSIIAAGIVKLGHVITALPGGNMSLVQWDVAYLRYTEVQRIIGEQAFSIEPPRK